MGFFVGKVGEEDHKNSVPNDIWDQKWNILNPHDWLLSLDTVIYHHYFNHFCSISLSYFYFLFPVQCIVIHFPTLSIYAVH